MSTNVQTQAISANLDALHMFLEGIQKRVEEARGYMQENNCSAVVGTMIDISPGLVIVDKLCRAIIVLHQNS
jgi:hypothetical protein